MEQIIKINVPEGKRAIYNEETQTIEFVNIIKRSKSWDEYCKNNPDEINFVEHLTCPIELADGIKALIKLAKLHEEWVGKDWKETTITDYSIATCLRGEKISVYDANTMNYMHSLLVFPTKEMAEEFLSCHKELIEDAKNFI